MRPVGAHYAKPSVPIPARGCGSIQSVGDEFLDTAVGRWAGVPHAARVLEHWTPTSLRADARQRWRRAFWISVIDWVCAGGFRSPRGGSQLVRDLLALRRTYVPESEGRKPLQASPRDGSEQPDSIRTAQDDDLPSPWHEWVSQVGTVPSRSCHAGDAYGYRNPKCRRTSRGPVATAQRRTRFGVRPKTRRSTSKARAPFFFIRFWSSCFANADCWPDATFATSRRATGPCT